MSTDQIRPHPYSFVLSVFPLPVPHLSHANADCYMEDSARFDLYLVFVFRSFNSM
jgi:hypothetical protein